jgi:hypothetical protein
MLIGNECPSSTKLFCYWRTVMLYILFCFLHLLAWFVNTIYQIRYCKFHGIVDRAYKRFFSFACTMIFNFYIFMNLIIMTVSLGYTLWRDQSFSVIFGKMHPSSKCPSPIPGSGHLAYCHFKILMTVELCTAIPANLEVLHSILHIVGNKYQGLFYFMPSCFRK